MIKSISFCVMAAHRSMESFQRCVDSIKRQNLQDYEILVGGINFEGTEEDKTYLFRAEWLDREHFPISEIQNEFCKRATKEFIVLIDANVELSNTWFQSIQKADCFDVIATRIVNEKNERIIDWGYTSSLQPDLPLPLEYDEWVPYAFVSGTLMTVRRTVWDHVEFDENLFWGQNEDVNFCKRASETGFRLGAWPEAIAIYHASDFNRPFVVFDEPIKRANQMTALTHEAQTAFKEQRFDKAVKLYEKILDSKSDVATLWSELGWSLYFCNKYADAKKVFQKTLSLNKQFHPAYRALGWIDYQLGQFDQAIPSFNEALKTIQSSDGAHAFQETLRGRGWAYFHQQHFNEAIGDFTKALEYTQPDEKNALQDLLRGRGWAYCAMNCFKEGEQDFSKAIELIDPQDRSVLEDAKKGLAVAQKAEKEGFKVGSKSPKAKPILGTDASHLPGLTGRVKNKIKKILSPYLKR